jgi:hypothetical protein
MGQISSRFEASLTKIEAYILFIKQFDQVFLHV